MEHSEVVIPMDRPERVQRILRAISTQEPQMPAYVEYIQDATAFDPEDAA